MTNLSDTDSQTVAATVALLEAGWIVQAARNSATGMFTVTLIHAMHEAVHGAGATYSEALTAATRKLGGAS